jgi:putative FmdB family regulatory protein
MPTYEYSCPSCGTYDVEQRITEPALSRCARCGAPVKRLISQSSFTLRGGGWYADGYGSKKRSDGKTASAEPKAANSEPTKSCATGSGACGGGSCGRAA